MGFWAHILKSLHIINNFYPSKTCKVLRCINFHPGAALLLYASVIFELIHTGPKSKTYYNSFEVVHRKFEGDFRFVYLE